MPAPSYVAYTVLGGGLAILAAVLFGLHHAVAHAGWPPRQRATVWRTGSLVLIAWFVAANVLGWLELFRATASRIPTIGFGVFVPIIVGAIALRGSGTLRRILDATPQSWLVGVQLYRAMGVIFLTLFAAGRLPGAFALPAGIGDILVGIEAPLVTLMYARGAPGRERLVRAWNVFGLLDLVVAVTTGFLTSPSPLQMLSLAAPNELITGFPLVMIPVFAVPVAVLLHLASLLKLRQARALHTTQHGLDASAA
jgi:hypothetical protein